MQNEWQPIETAPRDGTSILGFRPGDTFSGHMITAIYWCGSSPVDSGWWALCEAGDHSASDEFDPTHWMPLPEPPTEGQIVMENIQWESCNREDAEQCQLIGHGVSAAWFPIKNLNLDADLGWACIDVYYRRTKKHEEVGS